MRNAPALSFWNGHVYFEMRDSQRIRDLALVVDRPSYTADKINYKGMERITGIAEKMVAHLGQVQKRPQYVRIAGGGPFRRRNVPKLGIVPDYMGKGKGLRVDDVRTGGPAAKGGMKAGDVIVTIAGKKVTNITTYMAAMGQTRRGRPAVVEVLRKGKRLKLKVVPK